jgi:hypothetical protein
LGATSAAEIVKVEMPEAVEQDIHFVNLRLEDSSGHLISENFYWLAGNDDFTNLSQLPEVKLDVEVEEIEIENRSTYKIRLKNPTENLAFFVNPSIRKGKIGEEVLPCFWSDNYFSILPERHKELTVEFQKQEFKSEGLVLKLDGWNVVSQTIQID